MDSFHSSYSRGDGDNDKEEHGLLMNFKTSKEKVLKQEPEILPCHAAISSLSPQLSMISTPHLLGPSIQIEDL
ncbi:hypothetical protein COCNU_04G003790 [Cocos nucifera]|uniref:Uncharacterized protein n=1 Tax=Cocos nucifera TaxID=13894 RepID=A0A8K0MZX0_COCNU|nr:hypothetical protein COCNU_04G003790 [Cocos nucifera]